MRNIIALVVIICVVQPLNTMAQIVKESSGVVYLNMSKELETPDESASSSLPIPTARDNSDLDTGGAPVIKWNAPSQRSIHTSRATYTLRAEIRGGEQLRVLNIFLNGDFYKNIIVNDKNRQQLSINETIELKLGNNVVKIEGIGEESISDRVTINYDISKARYYALIIAVEDYSDPAINDLSEPINDADKFISVISSRYTFNEEDITYLKNPTKADIIGTLHRMRSVIKAEDNLLIYYAGHGYWDEEMMTGYWLPSDAERDNPVNWLPNTDLTNYMNVLKTKHTLLIADACFSGGIFKTRSAFNSSASVERLYKLPSRKAITSGTLKEVPDQSVFIEYLIKRLNENNVEFLSSEQLFSSMRTAVMNNSDNVPQYGTVQNVGDEGGDFVFIMKK